MNSVTVIVTVGCVVIALVLLGEAAIIIRRRRSANGQRGPRFLENYLNSLDPNSAAGGENAVSIVTRWGLLHARLLGLDRRHQRLRKLAHALADADIPVSAMEWLGIQFVGGVVLGIASSLYFGNPLWIPPCIALAYVGGSVLVRIRQGRRRSLFDSQLGDTLQLLGAALRAGNSLDQAMQAVAEQALPPIRFEFQRYMSEVQLGVPAAMALDNMATRNPSLDLGMAITAIQVFRETGGNLAEILDRIAEVIRARVQIGQEIRALTAQARMSGWVVALIPFVLAVFLNFSSHDYFSPMFKEAMGIGILVTCGVLVGIGMFLIRRIVDIRV